MVDEREILVSTLKNAVSALSNRDNSSLLIACSGGSDSVSLVMAAHHASLPFAIAHVNYGLRGEESDLDEAFVRELGATLSVPVYTRSIPSSSWKDGGNIQDQARQMRYEFFEDLLSTHQFQCCLLAHQQDDQSETILMSLIRGNQFRVLSPMPDSRPGYLRPFLSIPREVCRKALILWEQDWREDSSNTKSIYTRNQVRNEIFPLLCQINPSASAQLSERATIYQQQRDLLKTLLAPYLEDAITSTPYVRTFDWSSLPNDLVSSHLKMILASVLDDWGWHGYDLWAGAELSQATPGKVHQFQGDLVRGRNLVQWIQLPDQPIDEVLIKDLTQLEPVYHVNRQVQFSVTDIPKQLNTGSGEFLIALENIHWPLKLRAVQTGDKFTPLGMTGKKLVSDMMIDAKFRPAQKRMAVVLEDEKGLIWLSDFRIADRVKITEESQQVIRLVTEPVD